MDYTAVLRYTHACSRLEVVGVQLRLRTLRTSIPIPYVSLTINRRGSSVIGSGNSARDALLVMCFNYYGYN